MTTNIHLEPIGSFEEALEQEYTFLLWPESSAEAFLKNAAPGSGPHRAYHQVVLQDPKRAFVGSDSEALETILSDPKALYFSNFLAFMGDKRILSLPSMQDKVMSHLSFALQKDSELLLLFDYNLLKVVQSGLLGKLVDRWLRDDRPQVGRSPFVEEATALGFDNLMFPGLMLGAGVCLSLVLGLLEVAMRRKKEESKFGI